MSRCICFTLFMFKSITHYSPSTFFCIVVELLIVLYIVAVTGTVHMAVCVQVCMSVNVLILHSRCFRVVSLHCCAIVFCIVGDL